MPIDWILWCKFIVSSLRSSVVIGDSDLSFRAWFSCHKNEIINKTKIFNVRSGHSKSCQKRLKPSLDWHHRQTLDTKSCRLFKCASPIAKTRPIPAFLFWIFYSERNNDNAKLQIWPVILPFPKEIDCIKCVVWLQIKEIDFVFWKFADWTSSLKMMKWSLMDSSSENVIRRNADREMTPRDDGYFLLFCIFLRAYVIFTWNDIFGIFCIFCIFYNIFSWIFVCRYYCIFYMERTVYLTSSQNTPRRRLPA